MGMAAGGEQCSLGWVEGPWGSGLDHRGHQHGGRKSPCVCRRLHLWCKSLVWSQFFHFQTKHETPQWSLLLRSLLVWTPVTLSHYSQTKIVMRSSRQIRTQQRPGYESNLLLPGLWPLASDSSSKSVITPSTFQGHWEDKMGLPTPSVKTKYCFCMSCILVTAVVSGHTA